MKNIFFTILALTFLFLSSCSKKEDVQPVSSQAQTDAGTDARIENGRIVFKDLETFNMVRTELAELTPSEAETWKSNFNFVSLEKALITSEGDNPTLEDLQKFNFPAAHLWYLNEKGEFQIGETIFWYHDGYKYEANGEDALKLIKENPALCKNKSKAGGEVILIDAPSNARTSTAVLGTYGLDARHQYQFNAGGQRKYVHELVTYRETYIVDAIYLYLRIKMEYKGSKGWKPAGEKRDIFYNFSWAAQVSNVGNFSGNFNNNHYNVNDIQVSLISYLTPHNGLSYTYQVNVNGSISQQYTGGTYRWDNIGYPLW